MNKEYPDCYHEAQADAAPDKVEQLMEGDEECRLAFEEYADNLGMDLSSDFFNLRHDPNRYINSDTRLAYDVWCHAIASRDNP